MLAQLNPGKEIFTMAGDPQIYNAELRCLFVELMNVSHLLNGGRTCYSLDPYAFQNILISASYQLLHLRLVIGGKPVDYNDNARHLGLLAFMTTLLFQQGRSQRLSYNLLAGKLRDAIEATSSKSMDKTTLLWLLLIGGVSVFDAFERTWLLSQIKSCLCILKIDSWQTARDKIQNMPWIDAIHEKPGQHLWEAMIYN